MEFVRTAAFVSFYALPSSIPALSLSLSLSSFFFLSRLSRASVLEAVRSRVRPQGRENGIANRKFPRFTATRLETGVTRAVHSNWSQRGREGERIQREAPTISGSIRQNSDSVR